MFLGYARAGWMGALVAGVCFVVPGFVVMLTLTLLYTTFAAASTLRGAFYGLAPCDLLSAMLEQEGFRLIKQKGSIRYYAKAGHPHLIRVDFHGAKEVPTGNLLLSLLDKFDIHQDSIGDSTGRLDNL